MAQMDGKMSDHRNEMKKTKNEKTLVTNYAFLVFVWCVHKRCLCSTSHFLAIPFFCSKNISGISFCKYFRLHFYYILFFMVSFSSAKEFYVVFWCCIKKSVESFIPIWAIFAQTIDRYLPKSYGFLDDRYWFSIRSIQSEKGRQECRKISYHHIYRNNNDNRNVCVWCDPSIC